MFNDRFLYIIEHCDKLSRVCKTGNGLIRRIELAGNLKTQFFVKIKKPQMGIRTLTIQRNVVNYVPDE